ncbi:hypothetical protein WICPIJ_000177 [Wickerhamomyces pijperi]|uniref:Beta-mannosidase B n=1 Tax=Wickerhamomyces pijperi TaxID=599730 RepID=A0A9P8QHC0_WICPI|nr:hypothetical protein WICPIJ_000177 [Wickerhamomyces pijperi]
MSTTTVVTPLKNWYYKNAKDTEWSPSKNPDQQFVEIFPDLISNGVIQDPFYEEVEKEVQWVGQTDWEYQTEFTIEDDLTQNKSHILKFTGLDTFATVYLNDQLILSTDNQFRTYTYEIVQPVKHNKLRVYLKTPLYIDEPKVKTFTNADPSRMHVRKAQYHYGWDWGPILVTCSPGFIDLISYEQVYIDDVYLDYQITDVGAGVVEFTVKETLHGDTKENIAVSHELVDAGGGSVWKSAEDHTENSSGKLTDAKLWYPFQYGDAYLYTLKTSVSSATTGTTLDTKTTSVGFRKVEVCQDKISTGTVFYFKINNIAVYMNGSNWIPAHNFLSEVTDDDYEAWLALLKDSNQNMLRIWGGGIYETDKLYEIANREGILIWQDFLFACGQYPNGDHFKANVATEAKQNVVRLRNNPSLVIFAGNNEDYQIRDEFQLSDEDFWAKEIYEGTLASAVADNSNIAYIKGTPFSPEEGVSAYALTQGDVHQWNIWHGDEKPYQQWDQLVGRFVSEFGMEAYPNYKTLAMYISKENLYPQSPAVECHNKADLAIKKLPYYVFDNLKITRFDLHNWIFLTQLVQAECHSFALQAFRRLWNQRRECGGQLVWQINDCYPVTSWALVDYEKRPKLGYFAYKRFSQNVIIGFKRREIYTGEDRGKDYKLLQSKDYDLEIWVSNLQNRSFKAAIEVKLFEISKNKLIDIITTEAEFPANLTTEHQTIRIPSGAGADPNDIVAQLNLYEIESSGGKKLIHSNSSWPQPLKYVKFSNDRVVKYQISDGEIKVWSNDTVVKSVDLQFEKDFIMEDNGFDLFPGDVKVVKVKGLTVGDKLDAVRFYDQPVN